MGRPSPSSHPTILLCPPAVRRDFLASIDGRFWEVGHSSINLFLGELAVSEFLLFRSLPVQKINETVDNIK